MKCFTFFDEAVKYASGGTVDASQWRWDPRGAVRSPAFTEAVNGAPGDRRILSIEFEHPDHRGYALVTWGTGGNCRPGSERVVKNLGQTADRWWTDRISSFAPYNGCFVEHFDDSNLGSLIGGQNYKSNIIKGDNRTNALSLHGGLSAQEAQNDCQANKAKCTYEPTSSIEYVPSSMKSEMLGWNCTVNPQKIRFANNITRTSSYSFSVGTSSTYGLEVGSGAAKAKIETTLSTTFGSEFSTQLSQWYDATQDVSPGYVGIISSGVSVKRITGKWTMDYPNRKWYHHYWYPTMTADQVDKDKPMNISFQERPMTASEKSSFCPQSATGTTKP
ncbi:hypothetical protein [Streptomyces vinaceus]|uniref:hypothetical protein n=1 Tax=Streptomyces vinaceus TaxID=1960 RepID=UPI00381DD96C